MPHFRSSEEPVSTAILKRPSNRRGKQNRAEAVRVLKEKALAELIPDPLAPGALKPEDFLHGLARPRRARRPRLDS
jgi:hypothetical protein